jgi:hypothetical protein
MLVVPLGSHRKVQEAMDRSSMQQSMSRNSAPAHRSTVQDWSTLRAVQAKSLPTYSLEQKLQSEQPHRRAEPEQWQQHIDKRAENTHDESAGIGCQIETMR